MITSGISREDCGGAHLVFQGFFDICFVVFFLPDNVFTLIFLLLIPPILKFTGGVSIYLWLFPHWSGSAGPVLPFSSG